MIIKMDLIQMEMNGRIFFICGVLLVVAFSANAQKLPNIQETSMRAPASIKIDGKRPEWDNQIQAINKAAGVLYTISNDDDKLFLVVLAADLDIANKIINAGLTFTINGSGRAHDEGGMSVTFPFLYKEDHRDNLPLLDYNNEIAVWNQQLTAKTKDIRVAGVKGVKDTISIYNTDGIRVAALFGDDEVFTWELAIPLKYLSLSVKDKKPFSYNIKLNGSANYPLKGPPSASILNRDGSITPLPTPPLEVYTGYMNQREAMQHVRSYLRGGIKGFSESWNMMSMMGPSAPMVISLISPTWFSGEYTLAK
jgi:hypothetical protein